MNCLDCETYETALQSVSNIMGISKESLLSHLVNTDYNTLYEPHWRELLFVEFLFKSVCDFFQVQDFKIDVIYWFHLSRTMHPEWFWKKGILSLQEIEPLLRDEIEKLRQKLRNPPPYVGRGNTYEMYNWASRQGPFAMLVKDVAFCHDEIGNHDYLAIPECVEDMGEEIADLFRKNSISVVVKFQAQPQFEAEWYLEKVVCYLYSAIHKMELSIDCNTCYEAPLHRIPPEDIIYVKEVSEHAEVSYKGLDL